MAVNQDTYLTSPPLYKLTYYHLSHWNLLSDWSPIFNFGLNPDWKRTILLSWAWIIPNRRWSLVSTSSRGRVIMWSLHHFTSLRRQGEKEGPVDVISQSHVIQSLTTHLDLDHIRYSNSTSTPMDHFSKWDLLAHNEDQARI